MGEAGPLVVDLGHLELELGGREPGIRSLGPELAQLNFPVSDLLLLLLGTTTAATATSARLLEVFILVSDSS